ncbi:MAG TPA: hypothetical protein VFL83_07090 [Anaeromyxobacter sp.]|nr:hypothetical protein [Anaeromyxobacter sp.]
MTCSRRTARAGGIALALAALAGCGADTAKLSPIAWQKVTGPGPGGAVLGLGAPGDFDERGNFTVSAFEDAGVVWLYYGGSDAEQGDPGCPGIRDTRWRVGLARSTDGVAFTRVRGDETGGAVLDVGAPGAFDSVLAYRPFVLKDGDAFRMWYNGSDHPFRCPGDELATDRRIGYAESADGVHWTKRYDGAGDRGSVLPLGAPGEFDEQQLGYVWVMRDGAQYRMYYSAADGLSFWRVGLAVSSDARTWTKVRGTNGNGSVLDLGPVGALDSACAYQPSVVKERDQLWRMWYRGCEQAAAFGGPSGGTIGYAESNDGITWVKIPQPGPNGAALGPGPAGSFDSGGLTTPSVILGPAGWSLYYAGFDTSGRFLTGLARAPR